MKVAYAVCPIFSTTDPDDLNYHAAYQALFRLKEEGFGGIILFNKPQSPRNT